MIMLAILLTSYLFWSIYSMITELYQEEHHEYFNNKLDDAIAITNWVNISLALIIFFIFFARVVYILLSCI